MSFDNEIEESDSEAHPVVDIESSDPSPHQQAVETEVKKKVESALALLSPQQRLIFTLKHFQGHTLNEIAVMLHCSNGTVKKHLFIAIRRLRKELKEYY